MKTPSQYQHRHDDAFTLIELLTVIAIIGILASIMIPTVGALRRSAHSSACLSNQRQIALAINLAATENRDVFPPASNESGTLWPSTLRNYLGGVPDISNDHSRNTSIVVCPSRLFAPSNPNEINRSSYSLNPYVMVDITANETGVLKKVPVSMLKRPSETILVADGSQQSHGGAAARFWQIDTFKSSVTEATADSILDDGPDTDNLNGYLRFRHKEKINVAFADAHTATLAKGTLRQRNLHISY